MWRAFAAMSKVALAAMVVLVVGSSPASADGNPAVEQIKAGNDGQVVGTATFTRTNNPGDGETLTVSLTVPLGMDEAHLCLSATPFTERVSPGSCEHKHEDLGGVPADEFVVDLGTTYEDEPVYAQLHVTTSSGETAYAGWVQAAGGGAFYGNVRVDPFAIPGVPAAPMMGAAAPVAGVAAFAAGAGLIFWRRTQRAAVATRRS